MVVLVASFLLIKTRKNGHLGEIVLGFAGRGELAEVEGFAPGGEVALAGGPVAGAAPVFLRVEEDEQDDEHGGKARQPNRGLVKKALHPVTKGEGARGIGKSQGESARNEISRGTGGGPMDILRTREGIFCYWGEYPIGILKFRA